LIKSKCQNWELPSDQTTKNKIFVWIVLVLSTVVYGGLHMLAWDTPFRTRTEQFLRRISAPTLMGHGSLFVAYGTFIEWNDREIIPNSGLPLASRYVRPLIDQRLALTLNLISSKGAASTATTHQTVLDFIAFQSECVSDFAALDHLVAGCHRLATVGSVVEGAKKKGRKWSLHPLKTAEGSDAPYETLMWY
jgi:hypothetical protein